ncbi:MAG TPA: hypothetical protein VD997_12540 [Phycisphaerales bacterium]|nr:hypothetical protein [Phycisphaerales bacterium]
MRYTIALAGALAAASAAHANLTVFDPTMADADWSLTKVHDTTPMGDAQGTGLAQATGGNPGGYRFGVHNWQIVPSGVSIAFAHLRSGAVWMPSGAGAITSVSVSFDAACFQAPLVNAVALGLVCVQNGDFYFAVTSPSAAIAGNGWSTFSGTFTQASFQPLVPGAPNNLDFSSAGAPIQFGFYSANGGSGASMRNGATFGVDNFNLTIVPAPGVLALAGLGALAAGRRRR